MKRPNAKYFGALIGALLLSAGAAYGQQTNSPKGGTGIYVGGAICAASNMGFVGAQNFQPCVDGAGNGKWFTVDTASLKASTNKSFFVSPSLETGIYTNTQVKGGSGSATATAAGSVSVRVLLDCSNCAPVGMAQGPDAIAPQAGQPDPTGVGIVYDARIQQLTATLGNAIVSGCVLVPLPGFPLCTPEQIDLIISTTSAHTFNFILTEVGSGAHTVTVQARLDAGNVCYGTNGIGPGNGNANCTAVVNTGLASSASAALFGLGSVTVIPVQLAPGFNF